MIQTCKYCLNQKRSCDECGSAVTTRTITEMLPSAPYRVMATFLLCTNLDCKEYGKFNKEYAQHIESYVCDSFACQTQAKLINEVPDVLDSQTHKEFNS